MDLSRKAIAFLFIAVLSAAAQGSPQDPETPPSMAAGNINIPTMHSSSSVTLTGQVVTEDGKPVPQAAIERVCAGTVEREGYTDRNGRFSVTFGPAAGVSQDVSQNAGTNGNIVTSQIPDSMRMKSRSEEQLSNCDLRAAMPGYEPATVVLAGRRRMDNPDVGKLVLKRAGGVAAAQYTDTALEVPGEAAQHFAKANELRARKKDSDARKELTKAVEIYPKYASAWLALGQLDESGKHVDQAKKDYQQAIAADPKFVAPYMQIAALAFSGKKWDEVLQYTGPVLQLKDRVVPDAYFYSAVANYNLEHYALAEQQALQAEQMDAQHRLPKNELVLAQLFVMQNRFGDAADRLRKYLQYAPNAPDAPTVRANLAKLDQMVSQKK